MRRPGPARKGTWCWTMEISGLGVCVYPTGARSFILRGHPHGRVGPADLFLFDQGLPGFGLRIHPSRRRVWIVQARIEGRTPPHRHRPPRRDGAAQARRRARADPGVHPRGQRPVRRRPQGQDRSYRPGLRPGSTCAAALPTGSLRGARACASTSGGASSRPSTACRWTKSAARTWPPGSMPPAASAAARPTGRSRSCAPRSPRRGVGLAPARLQSLSRHPPQPQEPGRPLPRHRRVRTARRRPRPASGSMATGRRRHPPAHRHRLPPRRGADTTLAQHRSRRHPPRRRQDRLVPRAAEHRRPRGPRRPSRQPQRRCLPVPVLRPGPGAPGQASVPLACRLRRRRHRQGAASRPPPHSDQSCRHVRREPAPGGEAARTPPPHHHRRLCPPGRRSLGERGRAHRQRHRRSDGPRPLPIRRPVVAPTPCMAPCTCLHVVLAAVQPSLPLPLAACSAPAPAVLSLRLSPPRCSDPCTAVSTSPSKLPCAVLAFPRTVSYIDARKPRDGSGTVPSHARRTLTLRRRSG